MIRTTGEPAALDAAPDRGIIKAEGLDLSFATLRVIDKDGLTVPRAHHFIRFSVQGPGEFVATDNGNPTNLVPFSSHDREAFNGLALAIVRSKTGLPGLIKITAQSAGLKEAEIVIKAVN
jgi:beta-galactosidase